MMDNHSICIVGGCGHVGLPLGLCFAKEGIKVDIFDINQHAVDLVNQGIMPFLEPECDSILNDVLNKNFTVSSNPKIISKSRFIIIVIGTPIDEYLSPDYNVIKNKSYLLNRSIK